MKNNIFLPETIRVGYQNRTGTYNGKLAYVIYIDEKGVVRKEAGWNSWRDKKIESDDFKNEPTSGFVLNKKAGGYSSGWNHRQTYCRVYDPRGFEFEITIPNLLYILENTNSVKGKGLEGDFIYGWEGKDLILVPVDSPDYKEIRDYTDKLEQVAQKKISTKELVLGATYQNKSRESLVYLGKFVDYYYNNSKNLKKFFFLDIDGYLNKSSHYTFSSYIRTYSGAAGLIGIVDEKPVNNYADLMDELEHSTRFSPLDPDKFVYESIPDIMLADRDKLHGYIYFDYAGKMLQASIQNDYDYIPGQGSTLKKDSQGNIKYKLNYLSYVDPRNKKLVKVNNYYGGYRDVYQDFQIPASMILTGTMNELNKLYNFKTKQEFLQNGKEKR